MYIPLYKAHDKKHLVQSARKDLITYKDGTPLLDNKGKKQYRWVFDYRHKNGVDMFKDSPIENQNDSWKTISNFFIPKEYFIGQMGKSYYFGIPTNDIDEANELNGIKHARYSKQFTYIIAIPRKFILNKRKNKRYFVVGVLNHFTYWITAIKDYPTYQEAQEILINGFSRKHPTRQKHLWNAFKEKAIKNKTLHVFHQTMEVELDNKTKLNWFRLAFRRIHQYVYDEYKQENENDYRHILFRNWLSRSKHYSDDYISAILDNVDWEDELKEQWLKVVANIFDTSQPYWATELFKK